MSWDTVKTRSKTLAIQFQTLRIPAVACLADLTLCLGWFLVENCSCSNCNWWYLLLATWSLWLGKLRILHHSNFLLNRDVLAIYILFERCGWLGLEIQIRSKIVGRLRDLTSVAIHSWPKTSRVLVFVVFTNIRLGWWCFIWCVHNFTWNDLY